VIATFARASKCDQAITVQVKQHERRQDEHSEHENLRAAPWVLVVTPACSIVPELTTGSADDQLARQNVHCGHVWIDALLLASCLWAKAP
jgi:hypothetical protein